MAYKPSKLDIGSIKRKLPPTERTLNYNLYFGPKAALGRPLSASKPKKTLHAGSLLSFAAISVLSVSLVFSLIYLSKVRSSSGEILGAATSAYNDLDLASSNMQTRNFDEALALFKSAQNSLETAQDKLDEHRYAVLIAPQARSANSVLEGAYFLSEAGRNLASALQLFDELKVNSQGVQDIKFNERLGQNHRLLSSALSLLNDAKVRLKAGADLPEAYRQTVAQALVNVDAMTAVLEKLIEMEDLYLLLFGSGQKTYLLVFQNYDEMRGTGGFIGTYGILKIDNGKIKSLNIDSIYDLDGKITIGIAAPGPFQPDIKRWGIRDANWFADFSLTAKKLLYFLEQAQETADGVIATTPKLFEELIRLIGPVYMEQYGVTLTADNFQELVQHKTSVDYDTEANEPKKFLADFAPVLLNRLMDLKKENWLVLFQTLYDNFSAKQILLYSKDAPLQDKIGKLNFGGRVLPAKQDYLAVVNSNMGGTKTDLEVASEVELNTKVQADGSVLNYLKISRHNTSDQVNRNYLRVLVPEGSELVSSIGIEDGRHLTSYVEGLVYDHDLADWDRGELKWDKVFVRTESGKTEFAAWVTVSPGEKREILFVYKLPFKVKTNFFDRARDYSILIQKQGGAKPYLFNHHFDSEELAPVWTTSNVVIDSDIRFNSVSNRDDYWATVLVPN